MNSQISPQWTNLILYKQINRADFLSIKETKKRNRECLTFIFDPLVKSLNSKRGMLHYRLDCSCSIWIPSVHTSVFMFHLISLSTHFIDHVSFSFPSVHSPSHSFHLPQVHLVHVYLILLYSYYMVIQPCQFDNFTFQLIPSLEINDLQVFLKKFLILDRYSLLEADLRCFYYSLSLYIKQQIQHKPSSLVRKSVFLNL